MKIPPLNDNNGFTIKLFFEDGDPDGIISIDLSTWNGKVLLIPRNEVLSYENRFIIEDIDEFKTISGPGVYFLFCDAEEITENKKSVYVGESFQTYIRLKQHISDYNAQKESFEWKYAVCFISKELDDDSIRKYIENDIRSFVKECDNYYCLTKHTSGRKIQRASKATASHITNIIKLLMPILNNEVFMKPEKKTPDTLIFNIKLNDSDAQGYRTLRDDFVVLKGSKISKTISKSMKDSDKKTRDDLINNGTIDSNGTFTKDFSFSSANKAACVITGNSVNGKTQWYYNDKCLREIEYDETINAGTFIPNK